MYYSGIDLHKRTCYITTLDETGAVVDHGRFPNNESVILKYFLSFGTSHKAVVECTANWYWLSDLLNGHGIELVLAHAKYLKAISYAKVKTDKVDSLTLAQLLRLGLIPVAHQIDPRMRGIRDLMRARLNLTVKKVSCLNSIHRILEKFNLSVPEKRSLSYPPNLACLDQLPLEAAYQSQVAFLCNQIRLLHQQIKDVEKWLRPVLVPNADVRRLFTLPGVGRITAYTIYVEVDDIGRFGDEHRFASYCRLVPGADNSSGRQKHKSGNKDGNRYLKIAFTDAAVRAIQFYAEIREFYKKRARKSHRAIARTIVAKELAKNAYYILKYKTEFETFKGCVLKRKKKYQWPRPASPGFLTGSDETRTL